MVWAGSMISRKAPLLAVAAWIRAQDRLPAGSTLLMFGDGPQLAEVRAAASGSSRRTPIHVPGGVDHHTVMQSLGSARALLFTSLRDTSSSQMLDAMSAGTPCVSLRHAGVRGLDLWYPAESGWVARANTWGSAAQTLSQAIAESLTADESVWSHKSEAGRAIAHRQTWTAKADRAIDWYATLLA
jgi:glycosyltransferase involved in cell wall biosynthesis